MKLKGFSVVSKIMMRKTLQKIASPPLKVHATQLINVLFMYTDGSCIGNSNVANKICPAGWGVVITKPELKLGEQYVDILSLEKEASQCILVDELYGPVVLDSTSPYYLHATVTSNNTSELSAIGEALIWLLHSNPTNADPHRPKQTAIIRYDSEYAAKSVQRIFNGTKNVELIQYIRNIYDDVCKYYEVIFFHVKGHSDHIYNDRADELANRGNKGDFCSAGRFAPNAVTYKCSGNSSSSSSARSNVVMGDPMGRTSYTANVHTQSGPKNAQSAQTAHVQSVFVRVPLTSSVTSGMDLNLPASADSFADRVQPKPRPVLSMFNKSTTIRSNGTLTSVSDYRTIAGAVKNNNNISDSISLNKTSSNSTIRSSSPKKATTSRDIPTPTSNNKIDNKVNKSTSDVIDLTSSSKFSPTISSSAPPIVRASTNCVRKKRNIVEFSSDSEGEEEGSQQQKMSKFV